MNVNISEITSTIRERGWCVVPDLLTRDQCASYISLLEASYDRFSQHYQTAANVKKVHGPGDVKLIYNLHNKHKDFLNLIFHDVVTKVAAELLSDGSYKNSEPFQVALTQARGLSGPQPAQQLHIDSYLPGMKQILVLQSAWALSDFVPGNGSTCFVEGSQNVDRFAEDGVTYESTELEASAGSLILFNGAVWHGSSPKTDEGTRWAIFNRYSRWFMRPSFDHSRNTPPEILECLTEEQKKMLGLHFRPPVDEFIRTTRISPSPEYDQNYRLPVA